MYSKSVDRRAKERGVDVLKLRVREVALEQGIADPVALAGKTGIAYATAYRLWQGKLGSKDRGVGVLVLYKIAQALGVRLSDLVVEEGPRVPAPVSA